MREKKLVHMFFSQQYLQLGYRISVCATRMYLIAVFLKQLFNANRPSIYVRVMQCTFASFVFRSPKKPRATVCSAIRTSLSLPVLPWQ